MNENLNKAREYLERSAPLGRYDCGKLCDKRCCKGGDGDGMWLFPGEEEFYKNEPGFTVIPTDGNGGYPMLVCQGSCDRGNRPLACRIYPFFPKIDGEKISVIRDLRGCASCPIIKDGIRPNPKFLRNLRKAARRLAADDEMKEYIIKIQNEIEEIAQLMSLMQK